MTNWLGHTKIDVDGYEQIIEGVISQPIDIKEKSTRGYKSAQFDLNNNYNDINSIVEDIKCQLKNFNGYIFDNNYTAENKKFNLLNAWTVVGNEGSYHLVHKHGDNEKHLSVVLYLSAPELIGYHMKGEFYYFLNDKDNNIKYHTIQPEKGTLIVMPTTTLHGAYPQPKGRRQTLNLDFEVTDDN